MYKNSLIDIIEEQVLVNFTGKVNVLTVESSQLLGHLLFCDGQVINAKFKDSSSLKAFYSICLEDLAHDKNKYIIEPEIVDISLKRIHYPFKVLKRKLIDIAEQYRSSMDQKPPMGLKILIEAAFIKEGADIARNEYDLLCTISDYNLVEDIYRKSDLLDFEITNALVSLRKKKALKVIKIA